MNNDDGEWEWLVMDGDDYVAIVSDLMEDLAMDVVGKWEWVMMTDDGWWWMLCDLNVCWRFLADGDDE